jgi:hypothetical protein
MTKRTSDGFMPAAITVNDASNISILGTHTAKPGLGVITMSDYDAGDTHPSVARGAMGVSIAASAATATIQGIRVIGTAQGSNFSNIFSYRADTVIEDNVGDTILQNDGVSNVDLDGVDGNIDNAAYEALP